MVMPPERLPNPTPIPPLATPTPTPMGGPMMTPGMQSSAPPSEPTVPPMPAKERTQEMPVPEAPATPLSQWEFLGAKWQIGPQEAYNQYWFSSEASDRKRFDEDYAAYINDFAGAPEELVGGAAAIFSPEEERMLTDLQNAISVGQMDEGQAWKVVENYWSGETAQSRRAEEAGRRGESLLAGAFPGKTLPMTGPGGMGEALQKQYGLPNLLPPIEGLSMPQALGVFGGAQQQMGLPQQLPSIQPPNIQLPNWQNLGQQMPQFGGRNFFDQLLQEGRSTGF